MTTRTRQTQRPTNPSAPRRTNRTTSMRPRRSARRAPSPLPEPLLAHRRHVASWSLQHGGSLRLDAITAIVGARSHDAEAAGRPFHEWTTHDVDQLLGRSATRWCLTHRVSPPRFLAESLCTYIDFLADTGLLAASADPPRELKAAAIATASLTRDGRRRMSNGKAASRSAHPASLSGHPR